MSAATVTVPNRVPSGTDQSAPVEAQPRSLLDEESRTWLRDLRAEGRRKDQAVARLHGLVLRAARFECARRRDATPVAARSNVASNDLTRASPSATITRIPVTGAAAEPS